MAEPEPDDEIAGEPGVMSGTAIVGPTGSGGYLVNGAVNLVPGMAEGAAFVAKDGPASEWLTQYVADTARGFDSYNRTAHDAGHDYLVSDDVAANGMRQVERIAENYI
jgi:hypothetical protein